MKNTLVFSLDDREFQLVTWSKDQYLRLWPITEDVMKVRIIHATNLK